MKNRYFLKIALLFFLVIGSFTAIGISSWIITNTDSTTHKDHDFDDDKVNVTVRYLAYTGFEQRLIEGSREYFDLNGNVTTSDAYISVAETSDSENDSSNWKSLNTLLSTYSELDYTGLKGELTEANQSKSIPSGIYESNGKDPKSDLKANETFLAKFDVEKDIVLKCTKVTSSCSSTTMSYQVTSGSFRFWREKFEVSYKTIQSAENEFDTISITKGSTITSGLVNGSLRFDKSNKYYLVGFYKASEDGSLTANEFDLSKPLEEDTSIYAVYNMENSELKKSELTAKINGNNGTLRVFNSSSADFNVGSDYTYFEPLVSVSIGDANQETIIQAGSTVNFCLNSGEEYKETTDNKDNIIEPEWYSDNLQYKICLQSDLVVNGNLTLGGAYGNDKNTDDQGMINKNYVCLDLNGHNIYVNKGGSFKSYGLIKNSGSSGAMYINGGYFSSLIVVRDYKGGNGTKNLSGKGIMPFALYSMPYTRCKLFISEADDGTLGTFECLLRMKGADLSVARTTVTLYFVGNSSKYFMNIKGKKDEAKKTFVCLDTYLIGGLSEYQHSKNKSTTDYKKCVLYKNMWTIENAVFSIESLKLNVLGMGSLDTSSYDFSISPFFDLRIRNSIMTFKQLIQMYPGSSLSLDEKCDLCFEYDNDRAAQLFVSGEHLKSLDDTRKMSLEFRNSAVKSGTGFNLTNVLTSSSNFWKYYGRPQVFNFGTTWFKSGNDSNRFYKIAGEFNCDKFGVYSSSISDGKTIALSSNEKLDSICEENGTTKAFLKTFGYDDLSGYIKGDESLQLKGYALPLISNGVAYLKDNTSSNSYFNQKQGTYDLKLGILNIDGDSSTYFLKIRESFDVSNRNVTITSGSYDKSKKTMEANGQKYVFFSECFYPFDETNNTINTISINGGSSPSPSISLIFDETYKMWLRPA